MPIYEYRCDSCGHQQEFIQKFNAEPLTECPVCKASALRKLVSAAAFHLKGSGWYKTDFKDGGKKKPDAKDETLGGGKEADQAKTGDKGGEKSEPVTAKSDKSESSGNSKPAAAKDTTSS